MPEILKAIDAFIEAQDTARITESPRLALEIAFAKIITQEGRTVAPEKSLPPVSAKNVPSGTINNKRGSVLIDPNPSASGPAPERISLLEDIRREWTTLTFSVSQQKMSVGANLQEGTPLKLQGNKLTVGFLPGNEFFKEFLDKKEHLKLISDVFSAHMKTPLEVYLEIAAAAETAGTAESLNEALSIFQGEVVNEWHNEK